MSTYSELEWLHRQLDETYRLLEDNKDSLLMRLSLEDRINMLESQIKDLGNIDNHDTTIRLWFAGDAVYGSKGISADFASLTSSLVSNMITTKYVELLSSPNHICDKGKIKGVSKSKMYLSNVLHGSFGYEMGWVNDNLFSELYGSLAIQEIIKLIGSAGTDEEIFKKLISNESPRVLGYLRKFYKELSDKSSYLRMESGMYSEILDKSSILLGNDRIKYSITNEKVIEAKGILRGLFMESGKFEFVDKEAH